MLAAAAVGRLASRGTFSGLRTLSTTTMTINTPFETHLCDGPESLEVEVAKDDMLQMHKDMYVIRRMEITSDSEYKARRIRGFLHLYDGQEAVAVGMQAGLRKEDDIVTTYRCHGLQYIRGDSVARIMAELYGFQEGSSKGKGGSMHFYSKANKFWGGAGIVGAQVPVGAGLAFSNKYLAKDEKDMTVSVAMYGDGAANQGQIHEAVNMAKLWDLPCIFMCENNSYGMGTSVERHSANVNYYQQGGVIVPGIRVDGMDVLAVRAALQWARDYCGRGNGPLFMEMKTYRYHGHSMSDPGLTYRDRDEVSQMRSTRDCIELVRQRIMDAGWATAAELKQTERELREYVKAQVEEARKGTPPSKEALYEDVYYNEVPEFIRGVEMETSVRSSK